MGTSNTIDAAAWNLGSMSMGTPEAKVTRGYGHAEAGYSLGCAGPTECLTCGKRHATDTLEPVSSPACINDKCLFRLPGLRLRGSQPAQEDDR